MKSGVASTGHNEVAEGSDDDGPCPDRAVGGHEGVPERKELPQETFAKPPVFRHFVEQIGLCTVPCELSSCCQ